MTFSFDDAHDCHNNLNFCIHCHSDCILRTDIMCICPDLFLCLCQYTQKNVPKSSNALRMKHTKTRKSYKSR